MTDSPPENEKSPSAPYPAPPHYAGMPLLVKFLIRHAAIGFGFACMFVGALIAFDVGRIGTILAQSDIRILATTLLVFMVGLTFSSVQMGYAVMTNPDLLGSGSGGKGSKVPAGRITGPKTCCGQSRITSAPIKHPQQSHSQKTAPGETPGAACSD